MTSSSSRHHAAVPAVSEAPDRSRGRVIDLASYRVRLDMRDNDSILNALWNELTRLAQEAWTWRDPETLGQVSRASWIAAKHQSYRKSIDSCSP